MILAIDVYYWENKAKTVGVLFEYRADNVPCATCSITGDKYDCAG